MSSVSAGVLTTLPVVCLGAFAPFAPRLAQRFGAERTLLFVLIVLTVGTAIRGLGTQSFLYMGAALAGAAIAVGNVLLPGVVKRDFPKTAAIMTGLYTMALCAGAASAAGFTIPIKNMLGGSWNLALAFWAVPAALVFVLWLPQALRAKHHVPIPVSRLPAFGATGLPGRSRFSWDCNRPPPISCLDGWRRSCVKGA